MNGDVFSEWVRWGWLGLANHLWQATLFALIAAAASVLLRRGPARARTFVWVVASAKFALPLALFGYLGSLAGLDTVTSETVVQTAGAGGAPSVVWTIVEPIGGAAASSAAAPTAGFWYLVLTAVWLVGASAAFGFWFARRRWLEQTIAVGRDVGEGREADALASARERLGVTKEIALVVSRAVHEPGVCRVVSPVVVLPEGMADQLGDDELEAVMMHEVAHVARRDNLVSNLQMALCCVFWFHPVVWLIDRKLLAERERACDEAVIGAGGRARAYATGLLKVFRFAIGWQPAGVSCATGSHLGRRIEQIMNSSDRISTTWHRAVLAAVVLSMVGVSAGAAALGQSDKREVRRDVLLQREPGGSPEDDLKTVAAASQVERTLPYDNGTGAPLTIETVDLRKVSVKQLAEAADKRNEKSPMIMRLPDTDQDGNATVLYISLTNTSDRTVTGYQITSSEGESGFTLQLMGGPVAPGSTFQIAVPVGENFATNAANAQLSVIGAKFDDGTTWGQFDDRGGVRMRRSER